MQKSNEKMLAYQKEYHQEHKEKILARKKELKEEQRRLLAPLKEVTLAHDFLDNSLEGSSVVKLALEKLTKVLEKNEMPVQYLSRVARDVADVQAKAVDKRLAIEGRPSRVVEHRDAAEIIRALEQKRVLKSIDVVQGKVIDAGAS